MRRIRAQGSALAQSERDDAPLRLAAVARFGAHPADVRRHAEDDGIGLELPHDAVIRRPVVDLALAVRPLAVGAVEPHLSDFAVAGEQFAELHPEQLVVARGIPVAGLMAVPRRNVDAEGQPGLAAGPRHFRHHVSVPVLPRAALHAVGGGGGRPQAEPVVVLGGQDEELHPGSLEDLHPLARVEVGRVEECRRFLAVAPFPIGEGVHAEMREGDELAGLPLELVPGRHDARRVVDDALERFARSNGDEPHVPVRAGPGLRPGPARDDHGGGDREYRDDRHSTSAARRPRVLSGPFPSVLG